MKKQSEFRNYMTGLYVQQQTNAIQKQQTVTTRLRGFSSGMEAVGIVVCVLAGLFCLGCVRMGPIYIFFALLFIPAAFVVHLIKLFFLGVC